MRLTTVANPEDARAAPPAAATRFTSARPPDQTSNEGAAITGSA